MLLLLQVCEVLHTSKVLYKTKIISLINLRFVFSQDQEFQPLLLQVSNLIHVIQVLQVPNVG